MGRMRWAEMSFSGDVLTIEGMRCSRTAIAIPDNLSGPGCLTALGRAAGMERGSPWWVGDLLVYYGKHYGETYAAALEVTGYSLGHLRNLKSVALRVRPGVRRSDLAWGVHKVVVACDEDDQLTWLALAENGWTAKDLYLEMALHLQMGANAGLDTQEHWEAAGMPVYSRSGGNEESVSTLAKPEAAGFGGGVQSASPPAAPTLGDRIRRRVFGD